MKISELAFRNIRRNIRRSLLSITAITIAAMSIVMLFSLLSGLTEDLNWNVQSFNTGQVRIRHKDFDENEILNPLHLRVENYQELISLVEEIPEVALVSPRINFSGIADPNDKNTVAQGIGVDFETEKSFQNIEDFIVEGRLPEMGTTEIVMGHGLADELGLALGDKVTVLVTTMNRGSNAATFQLVGMANWPIAAMNQKNFYLPIDKALYLMRMRGGVSELLVKFIPGIDDETGQGIVDAAIDSYDTLATKQWLEVNTLASLIGIADVTYTIMAFFFFLLASTVIINTTMMVIFERMREIGTIGAMGMRGDEIVKLFFMEAFYLGIIGSAVGVIIGIGFTLILGATGIDFTSAMEGTNIDMGSIIYPKLDMKSTIGVFFYSVAVASLTSIIPTRRAAKIEPVEALRHIG